MDVTSHVTSFNQLECFISVWNSYALIKFVLRHQLHLQLCFFWFIPKVFELKLELFRLVLLEKTFLWKVFLENEMSLGMSPVWPDWAIYFTLGNFLKPLARINLPKSPTFLRNFCKCVKIYHFSSENHFWATFKDIWQFLLVTLDVSHASYSPNFSL